MKKLIVGIAIFMIFVLMLGSLSKIDNIISDISSEINETTQDNETNISSGDVSGSAPKYTYNIQLRESNTNTYITTFTMNSTRSVANFVVNSNNEILLMAADGAMTGLVTDGWKNIVLSQTVVYPSTTVVYVTYTTDSLNTGHTHNYVTKKTADCNNTGLKECSCGASVTIPKTTHDYSGADACGAGQYYYCNYCGAYSTIPVAHIGDQDGNGKCDYCNESIS